MNELFDSVGAWWIFRRAVGLCRRSASGGSRGDLWCLPRDLQRQDKVEILTVRREVGCWM